jgi:hypothetical protein
MARAPRRTLEFATGRPGNVAPRYIDNHGIAMKAFSYLVVALVIALPGAAAAGQYSDLWFNPQESGWGLNLVQQDETAFATLFVYGPDGRPTWYVASNLQVNAYSNPGGYPLFEGTLYRTQGSWHGGPFNPGDVRVTAVGHMWVEVLAKDRLRLHYGAEGVAAVRELTRQSFAEEPVSTWYTSQFVLRVARADQSPIGTSHFQADVLVHLEDGTGFIRTDDHLGRRCEYRGPYRQAGKLVSISGTFTCTAGDLLAGSFELTDLEVTAHGITGYLRKTGSGVQEFGRFAATRY